MFGSSAPAELANFYAPFTTDLNATVGGGTLTGTGTGSPAIASGKLNLKGGSLKYVTFAGANNVSNASQTGCVRFKYTPNYSGTPAAPKALVYFGKGASVLTNLIELFHNNDGGLKCDFFNSAGGAIIAPVSFGAWSPTAGVEYEIEMNWDLTAGAIRLFVDGTQQGSTNTSTGTRSTDVTNFTVGCYVGFTLVSDAEFRHVRVFNAVQHTANYTPA